jgi:FMN phosphatase YigB (HAD superfamily)
MLHSVSQPQVLFQTALKLLEEKKYCAISLDVFDTLVIRRLSPDLILEGLAKKLEKLLSNNALKLKCDPLTAYHTCYAELVKINLERNLDSEVFTNDLYPAWVRAALADDQKYSDNKIVEIAELLRESMTNYELASCIANPELIPLLNELVNRKLKLYYISDMYLGGACVGKILKHVGLDHFFVKGYVSGDLALLKRSGLLFKHVIKELGHSSMLHIGDNPISDGKKAVDLGIDAIVYQSQALKNRIAYLKKEHLLFKSTPIWGGHLAATFAEELRSKSTEQSSQFLYGYRFLGPIFSSFIHKVLEETQAKGIKQICFLAREGHFLMKIAEKLLPLVYNSNEMPKLTYLLTSRISTVYGASRSFGLREITTSLANGIRNLRNLLSPLKLSELQLSQLAKNYGFTDPDWILPDFFLYWAPFLALLKDKIIVERWRELHEEQGSLLVKYLEEEGVTAEDQVAIVDVGWLGQIQDNLHLTLSHAGYNTKLFGFYLGLSLPAHWRKNNRNWIEWCIADEEHPDWCGQAAFIFPQSLEIATRAAHGTVIGYKASKETKQIEAILKNDSELSRQLEKSADETIAWFQIGALEYAKKYRDISEIASLQAKETLPYARDLLDRMLRFPTQAEANNFLKMINISDFGSNQHFKLGGEESKLSLLRIRSFRTALSKSFWKHGSLAYLGRFAQLFWSIWREARCVKKADLAHGAGIIFHISPSLEKVNSSSSVSKRNIFSSQLVEQLNDRLDKLYSSFDNSPPDQIAFIRNPLSRSEIIWCYLNFFIAKIACALTRRRSIKRGGIPFHIYVRSFREQVP